MYFLPLDPEEFLHSLLTQTLKSSPYLHLSSGQTSHLYQLFVEKDDSLTLPNVQQLLEQSFLTSSIKLQTVPNVLVLQLPRFGRQFKLYDRILPSPYLDVTDIIDNCKFTYFLKSYSIHIDTIVLACYDLNLLYFNFSSKTVHNLW